MGGLVWLASYPKSGNTWTRNFLHNLLNGSDSTHDINAMDSRTAWDSSFNWYRTLLGEKKPNECSHDEIATLRASANQVLAKAAGDGLLFVKTHNALMTHNGYPTIDRGLTAGAVYIVRNPLDIAVSYSHHLGIDLDKTIALMNRPGAIIAGSEKMVCDLQGSWAEHVDSWTRSESPSRLTLRYEDMLSDPHKAFGNMAGFLQIATTAPALDQAISASSFKKLRAMEEASGFREKPKNLDSFFRQGTAEQWREELSGQQIDTIVRANKSVMARFGYLPD